MIRDINKFSLISGHLTTTQEEFDQYYKPQIDQKVKQGCDLVIGGAQFTDRMAQDYIATTYPKVYLHVYDKGGQNNTHYNHIHHINGFESYSKRDAAMTAITNYDIAYLHTDGGGSGTFANLLRTEFSDELSKKIIKIIRKHTIKKINTYKFKLV